MQCAVEIEQHIAGVRIRSAVEDGNHGGAGRNFPQRDDPPLERDARLAQHLAATRFDQIGSHGCLREGAAQVRT
jgi:hypothetical protein